MNYDELGNATIRMNKEELISYLRQYSLVHREHKCDRCEAPFKEEKCSNFTEGTCWRCYNSLGLDYKKGFKITKDSF